MNLCVTLLKVVLVVVFTEVVLGDIEGGDQGSNTLEGGGSSYTKERECPPDLVDIANSSFSLKAMPLCVYLCFLQIYRHTSIGNRSNSTGDETETKVHEYCEEKSTQHLQCLAEYAAQVENCPDKMLFKISSIVHEYVGELIESGCAQNGQRFITLFKELAVIEQTSPLLFRDEKAKFKFSTIVSELDKSTVDMPSKLFIWHRELKAHVKYINTIEMGESFKEIMNYFADHLISHIKCIHPTDGTFVTCASIDAALVSSPADTCEVMRHGANSPLYDVLEHDAGKIFEITINHHTRDEDEIPDNESLKIYFKLHCSANTNLNSKLSPITILSYVCLYPREKKQFQLLIDSINNAHEVACTDEGKRLADIMFQVYWLKKNSRYHEHAVFYCIDAVKANRKRMTAQRNSLKNMRFYHELKDFKECLLHKLQGDQTSVDAATSLFDEMLKVINCINPENGTAERCYIIDNGIVLRPLT